MDYLGLFCLGAFVGTIATFGMRRVENIKDWQTVLTMTLPAVLSGAAMVFIDRFKYSPAFGCYPLGLAVALMWAYTQTAIDHVRSEDNSLKALGWLHLLAAACVTIAGAVVATIPAYHQVRAETLVSDAERVGDLRKYKDAALDMSDATTTTGRTKGSPRAGTAASAASAGG